MVKRSGMLDCLGWGAVGDSTATRSEVRHVRNLLALRDALRANEPAPFDAACWMADAIDKALQDGGSLDKRLGLKRRGKPSVRRTAEITRRDALFHALAACIPEKHINGRAAAVVGMIAGKLPPPAGAADVLTQLRGFKKLPRSSRQVMRILSARHRQ